MRKILAQTRGLQTVAVFLLLGILLTIVGSAISYKDLVAPILQGLSNLSDRLFERIFPQAKIEIATHMLGGLLLLAGVFCVYLAIRRGVLHLLETVSPRPIEGKLSDRYRNKQRLAYGPKIVALGGGTGLSTLLRGLKMHSSNITAIVTVTDDGGSSGRLSQEIGMIPPGDIRNCLVALADAEQAMTDLFQYRFRGKSGSLSGHSMGNLLIAALVDQAQGDFEKAVDAASKVLTIRGRVMPSTLERVGLHATLETGQEISGETNIVAANKAIRSITLDPPGVQPNPVALEAIHDADLIVIGPGSVYTSIIPNLLVPGIADALRNSPAKKVYVCNVMTQPGESDKFTASEHVTAVQINVHRRVFDYVLLNTVVPNEAALEKYRESGQHFVEPDYDRIAAMGFRILKGNFISDSDFVRHNPMSVASKLMDLLRK